MDKRTMKKNLKELIPKMERVESTFHDDAYMSIFLGSYLTLDPCGKYHHVLSRNGATKKCETFWDRVNAAADEVGGWISSGEGDALDIFFCMPIKEEEENHE